MCQAGITDSREYLTKSLKDLLDIQYQVSHVSLSIECLTPKIIPIMDSLRQSISNILTIGISQVGITATTGEGLTDFGKGLGIQVFCIVTATSLR